MQDLWYSDVSCISHYSFISSPEWLSFLITVKKARSYAGLFGITAESVDLTFSSSSLRLHS